MSLKESKTIGTVCYIGALPTVYEAFCYSYSKMVEYNAKHLKGRINYDVVRVSELAHARNSAVANCKGDWLLMLDTDATFEPDLVVRMVETMEKYKIPVLAGLYLYKKTPHSPVIYSYTEKTGQYQAIQGWQEHIPGKLFQVAAAGSGCLMVKKDVFTYIDQELNERPFTHIDFMGEDISFFDRLRRLKVPVFCCPEIGVNHIMVHPLVLGEDYDPIMKKIDKDKQVKSLGLV